MSRRLRSAGVRPGPGPLWVCTTAPLFPRLDLDPKVLGLIVDRCSCQLACTAIGNHPAN